MNAYVAQKKIIMPFAKSGYFARGIVYLVIGFFALLAAIGEAESKDSKAALEEILQQPLGSILVWLMVTGLMGYAIWRLVQSVFDTDEHGWKPRGLLIRMGLLASAATYFTLALYSVSLLGVFSASGDGAPLADSIAGVVGSSWASLILMSIFIGVGSAHFLKACKRKYEDHIDAPEQTMPAIHVISIFGLFARGMVFYVFAVLLSYRLFNVGEKGDSNPGIKAAMEFIQGLPFGQILLFFMGLGLLAFSAYSFAESIWRKINLEQEE